MDTSTIVTIVSCIFTVIVGIVVVVISFYASRDKARSDTDIKEIFTKLEGLQTRTNESQISAKKEHDEVIKGIFDKFDKLQRDTNESISSNQREVNKSVQSVLDGVKDLGFTVSKTVTDASILKDGITKRIDQTEVEILRLRDENHKERDWQTTMQGKIEVAVLKFEQAEADRIKAVAERLLITKRIDALEYEADNPVTPIKTRAEVRARSKVKKRA